MSRNDNAQTPCEGTSDTTYAFPAHLLGELNAPAAEGVEPRVSTVDGPPSRSALLLVMRGPNAGSQFLLDQPVTSAGRHPDSDTFLDDVTVSGHHVEFRLENGQFLLVDLDSLNDTYVNHEPVDSAVLVDGDEIQIGKCPGIRCPGARHLLRLRQSVVRLGQAGHPHRVVRPTRAPRTGRNYQRLCRCAGRAGDIPEIAEATVHLRQVFGDETFGSFAQAGANMINATKAAYALDQIDLARADLLRVEESP